MANPLGARWSDAVAAARFRGRNARYGAIFDALCELDLGTVADVALLLGTADLTEEADNHLVVLRRH